MIDINYIYPIMEAGITPACLISFENYNNVTRVMLSKIMKGQLP